MDKVFSRRTILSVARASPPAWRCRTSPRPAGPAAWTSSSHDAVVATDVTESGNTSAASIPLALSKFVERRAIPAGAPALLFGFGAGLTYAGQVITSP